MILKILKGVWFFSLVGLFVVFFYVYAGMPRSGSLLRIRRIIYPSCAMASLHFHFALRFYQLPLVFVVNKLLSHGDQRFSAWFYGLIVTFNFFFIVIARFFTCIQMEATGMISATWGPPYMEA